MWSVFARFGFYEVKDVQVTFVVYVASPQIDLYTTHLLPLAFVFVNTGTTFVFLPVFLNTLATDDATRLSLCCECFLYLNSPFTFLVMINHLLTFVLVV